ncbi:MAG: CDP-archaeol synthase [Gammaproteobacteria bacterium]
MNIEIIISSLIVLGLANGAPILAARLFGDWFVTPIDGGVLAGDGRPWLGASKTWRGLVSAMLLAMPVALWLGWPVTTAFIIISLSMLGDLLASFIKRRRGLAPSSRAIGLDQIPEAALPVIFLWSHGNLSPADGLTIVVVFMLVEVVLSRLLYRLHIRKRPY